jgi:hypothetical protein
MGFTPPLELFVGFAQRFAHRTQLGHRLADRHERRIAGVGAVDAVFDDVLPPAFCIVVTGCLGKRLVMVPVVEEGRGMTTWS